ncbi:MAG: ABC transporter permease [Gammaproteobacteria bacterium]|nr:ABC transporter permease [Gammaproteobacteria bacterium]
MFEQFLTISAMNIRNIVSRWSSSSVVVVGIAGVVAVLVAMLSMASGISNVFSKSTATDRAVVVRSGSDSELSSNLSGEVGRIVAAMDGVAIAAPELYAVADVPKKATGTPANTVVRGVETLSFDIRPKLKIIEGRMFESGRNEIIVGVKTRAEFEGMDIGNQLIVRESTWEVVGIFEADGSIAESEIWADLTVTQSAFRRQQSITVVRVQFDSPTDFDNVAALIEDDPRLETDFVREEDWFSSQSDSSTVVIRVFGVVVAIIMSIGAIFAALNTMYSAVAARTFEIATLRAIGFGGAPVLVSVMLEAMFLALVGGIIGAAISFLTFNGFTVSTLNQQTFSQVAFDFAVTPELMVAGLVLSLALGFIGGIFPGFRAVFLPVTTALRGE